MKILKATFQNFLTLSEACLELDDRGLLLITGKNDDDTSANSNGAGKSSLVDGICWALYGTTARDVSGDDVVNETAKKTAVYLYRSKMMASFTTLLVIAKAKIQECINCHKR